ncbi:MAG TPA: type II secretion system protein GspI [Janthinobacterium sp.]|nr:type II secretion system protein GspI [Janthinobacterium sp.]
MTLSRSARGFTLLEVLVALAIVGIALSACLSAVGNLTRNNGALRAATMATWSAENRLANIRIDGEWPPLGKNSFDCAQDGLAMRCEEEVLASANPNFRRVEVSVFDGADPGRRLVKLIQVVPNAL